MSSKSRQKEVCTNEYYFPLSTVYPFLYLVFKHSLCHQHRGFYGWIIRLQKPVSMRNISLTSQLIFVCQLQGYGISIKWDFIYWLAHRYFGLFTDTCSSESGKRTLQNFSFIFSHLNWLLFPFLCRHHSVDASLPQKHFHPSTLNSETFPLIFITTALYSLYRWERLCT